MKLMNRNRSLRLETLEARQMLSAVPYQTDDGDTGIAVLTADPMPAENNVPVLENPEELAAATNYDAAECAQLRAFLEQENEYGIKNGFRLNVNYDANDPSTWSGLSWNGTKVSRITWGNYSMVGSLNLSGFDSLQLLKVHQNNLTSLSVSNCQMLTEIHCYTNKLTSLTLQNLNQLQYLYCADNALTSLDVKNLPNLKLLLCHKNQLTSIDVTANTSLQKLACWSSTLETVYLAPVHINSIHIGFGDNNGYYWQIKDSNQNLIQSVDPFQSTSSFSQDYSFQPSALPCYATYGDQTISFVLSGSTLSAPTLTASGCGLDEIQVNIQSVSGAVGYVLEYSANADFSNSTRLTYTTAGNKSITGLSAGTTYYFRVRATAQETYQNSPYSAAVHATTDAIPLSIPYFSLTGVTSDSISVQIGAVANATSYTVQYSKYSDFSNMKSRPFATSGTYAISELDANTRYYFRVRANGEGSYDDSAWSSTRDATTLRTPLATPSLSCSVLSSSQIKVSLGSVAGARSYTLEYASNAEFDGAVSINYTTVGEKTISGLTANTQYWFRFKANDGTTYSDSAWNVSQPITTAKEVLSSPMIMTYIDTQNILNLVIGEVRNAAGYLVQYSENADFSQAVTILYPTSGQKKIADFNVGSVCYIRVQAQGGDSYADSDFTLTSAAVTGQTTLDVPTLSVSFLPGSLAQVTIGEVSNATGYALEYSTDSSFTDAVHIEYTTAGEKVLADFQPQTTYWFRVQATGTGNVWNSAFCTAVSSTCPKNTTTLSALTLSTDKPERNRPISAILGPEGAVAEFQWYAGDSADGEFTAIEGAVNAVFTPTAAEVGKFLRCTATGTGAFDGVLSVTSAQAVQEVLLEVQLVLTSEVTGADTSETLPDGLEEIYQGKSFFAEIWIRNTEGATAGISGGTVDLAWDPSALTAQNLNHGTIFCESAFNSGSIDAENGRISDFGGFTLSAEAGLNSWVRLGWVEMTTQASGEIAIGVETSDYPFARFGAGEVAWDDVKTTGAAINVTHSIYDLDSSGKVDYLDLVFLADAWKSQTGDTNWNVDCDFDGNGRIDYSDLSWFACAFRKDADDASVLYPQEAQAGILPEPEPAVIQDLSLQIQKLNAPAVAEDLNVYTEWSTFHVEIWSRFVPSREISLSWDSTVFTPSLIDDHIPGVTLTLCDDAMTDENGITTQTLRFTSTVEFNASETNEVLGRLEFTPVSAAGGLEAGKSLASVITINGKAVEAVVYPVIYDMDDNGSVGITDLVMFARLFGTQQDDAWKADFNSDGRVDIGDLVLFARNFGLKSTSTNTVTYSPSYKPVTNWNDFWEELEAEMAENERELEMKMELLNQ